MEYDDALMDQLLDQEWSLLERYPDDRLEFFYFSLPRNGAKLPVPEGARLVYG